MVYYDSKDDAANVFPDAVWLWSPSPIRDERDRRLHFRRTFKLKDIPESAEIKITADAFYTLWVNGKYVNRGPARGFQHNWPFDRIELRPYLKRGKNVLAVMVYQYGISNYSYAHEWNSGLLLSGRIGNENLGTDSIWKFREAPGYIKAVARASGQYCFQEFFDCRIGDDSWQCLEYDDSSWSGADGCTQRTVGCMPWNNFSERGIPLLTDKVIHPVQLIATSSHIPAENWQHIENIGYIYTREKKNWEPVKSSADAIVFDDRITAQLLDFGQEVVGHLQFAVESEKDGEPLDFMVTESVHGCVPDFPDFKTLPQVLFGGRLILRKGKNFHELTMPWGFRYLVLLRRGTGKIKVLSFVRQTIYPLDIHGKFQSSDERLNAIWKISEHGQRCCMVDSYIDCPWRENAQWWGDALVQWKNTSRLSCDARLFERGLQLIASQTVPNGLTYAMAPTCGHNCILPDYSAIWIVTLFAHYWHTGEPYMWLNMQKTVDGILGYFKNQSEKNGLVPYDSRYWLFLDWCPQLFKQGYPTLLNMFYLWALKASYQMASVTGDQKRILQYKSEMKILEDVLIGRLHNSETKLWYDGISLDGEKISTCSPHVAALGILLELLPETHQQLLDKVLLPLVRGSRNVEILPSPYFMYYIFEALKLKGYKQEVVDCIRNWWGEFVDFGCSTTPEHWLDKISFAHGSICHAWSAHPLLHFSEIILGVRQILPGWKKIAFKPLVKRGEKASGCIPTPLGDILVSWDWSAGALKKQIKIPAGMEIEKDDIS